MVMLRNRMADDPSDSPSPSPTPRQKVASRACDRCRRRKVKCDITPSDTTCTLCRSSQEACTFDVPLARRGPKSKRQRTSAVSTTITQASPGVTNTDTSTASVNNLIPFYGGISATSSPSNTWEPSGAPLDVGLSPAALRGSVSDSGPLQGPTAGQRWSSLANALSLRSMNIEHVVNKCLALFFEYLYPLTPLVHEPSLRQGLAFFLGQGSSPYASGNPSGIDLEGSTNPSAGWEAIPPLGVNFGLWADSTFTLITAVCAEAAFLLPKDIFPEGEMVAGLFLQASRHCLQSYLESDLESPNANSVTIRYFHSNCIHASGKPKYSWHIFGEGTRLAQVMQLYQESSFEGLFPIEAEMRRRAFWILYMGDKSAAILNNRPITIHKFSFEEGITTAYPTGFEDTTADLDPTGSMGDSGRRGFIQGFNANLRLWQAASDLILEARLFNEQGQAKGLGHKPPLTEEQRQRLNQLYIQFITCLDDLPPHLQTYTFAFTADDHTQSSQSIIQCANLQVSLHCLHMVITEKFEDLPGFALASEQADLRKTDIARDMLRVMHEAPFWSLQVNGEPYVEKIRLIGASLLKIIHRHGDSPLAARARRDFSVLLDILTRLDSKASDALRSNSTWIG